MRVYILNEKMLKITHGDKAIAIHKHNGGYMVSFNASVQDEPWEDNIHTGDLNDVENFAGLLLFISEKLGLKKKGDVS